MTERGPDDIVIDLGVEPLREPVSVPRPTSRLHSTAVALTTACGVLALISTLAFVTIGWPGTSRRIVIAVLLFTTVGFITGVAITILGAARDTYARKADN